MPAAPMRTTPQTTLNVGSLPPRPFRLRWTDTLPAGDESRLLGCVIHGAAVPGRLPHGIHVDTPLLAGHGVECWDSPVPVSRGGAGDIAYAENGDALFGQLRVDAAALSVDTAAATEQAFRRISEFLDALGYRCWRMWNYIPDIHRGDGDQERYRQFVLGRYRALATREGFEQSLPAATAIGTQGDDLLIYWLAGRHTGTAIENPRQTSAWRYPRQYGPRSPSFARALRLDWRDGADLLVSGTASIVGHETLHHGDPAGQLREILANLDALRAAAGRDWRAHSLKLFLRDPQLLTTLRTEIDALAQLATLSVLHGDICRSDLHLEIEPLYDASA